MQLYKTDADESIVMPHWEYTDYDGMTVCLVSLYYKKWTLM